MDNSYKNVQISLLNKASAQLQDYKRLQDKLKIPDVFIKDYEKNIYEITKKIICCDN